MFSSPVRTPAPQFSGLKIFNPPGGNVAMGYPPVNFMLTNDTREMGLDQVLFNGKVIAESPAVRTLSESMTPTPGIDGTSQAGNIKNKLKALLEEASASWGQNTPRLLDSLEKAKNISYITDNINGTHRITFIR